MTDKEAIDHILRRIGELKRWELEQKPGIEQNKRDMDTAKDELLPLMAEYSVPRFDKYGCQVIRQTKTTYGVSDRMAAAEWLNEQEWITPDGEIRTMLDRFMTVDAKAIYDAGLDECPGVYAKDTEYISVKEEKR